MTFELCETLLEIVREAGRNLDYELSRHKKVLVREKHDIKLELDQYTELFIKDRLLKKFPHIGFIAEELDPSREEKEGQAYWVIDPIDGTSNFAAGIPHFCISVALREDGQTILGVIYDPVREEMFRVEKGKGAFCNNQPMKLQAKGYEESFCVMGLYKTPDTIDKGLALLESVAHEYNKIRITGSAALDLAWVAAGRFQVFFEYGIRLWDIAAGELMVREAGGKVITEPYREVHTFFIVAGLPEHCDHILEKRDRIFSSNTSV